MLLNSQLLPMVLIFIWEHWLGKTDKVDANSTIQLIVNILKWITEKIRSKYG